MLFEDLPDGNIDAAPVALAEDATWWLSGSLPVPATYTGRKEIFYDFFGKTFARFERNSISIHVQDPTAERDAVVVEWFAEGKTDEYHYHAWFDRKEMKIHMVREYADALCAKDVASS